jgi:uncharacterized protein (TIGR02246 family)
MRPAWLMKSMVFWRDSNYNGGMIKSELIEEAIQAVNRKLESEFAAGNAKGMAECYTEDGQLLPTGSEPITGRAGIAEFWGSIIKLGMTRLNLEAVEIDPQGATVIEQGRYSVFRHGDSPMDHGKYMVIWKLVKGEWKLHRDIWNTSIPSNSGRNH